MARDDQPPPGARSPAERDSLAVRIRSTGRAARIDDYAEVQSPGVRRERGLRAAVGVPVVVEGRLWGLLAASSADGPLPPELAAHDAPPEAVLAAVAREASWLAGVDFTTLLRFEPDGSTEIIALAGAPEGLVVGMRAPAGGDGATQRVWRTGRPARVDDLTAMSGHWPQVAHGFGFSASAASPVLVHGALWGALVVVGRSEPLPAAIAEHLANFAELAGTAISATRDRQELRLLADEQAALRRVAELVARGAALDEVFAAVASEASTLLGDLAAALLRYEPGGSAVVVASCNSPAPVGLRVPAGTDTGTGEVLRTGRPVRVDSFAGTALERMADDLQVGAALAVPVVVEGNVWGALTSSTSGPALPAGLEERLGQFADLAAAAIANAENKAKLTASRARVVATADETRRRIQRDVHDSAQQRLVHAIITLKLARGAIVDGRPADDLVEEALRHAEHASRDLRDVVRGLLPAALARGGLRAGLESLVDDLPLPVDLQIGLPEEAGRLPAPVETTAYFVVAEALTNVVKHANAGRATVRITLEPGTLVIDVRDDGSGGADAGRGTGLTGLLDRVEAGDGRFDVTSPLGGGTSVHATLPLGSAAAGSG